MNFCQISHFNLLSIATHSRFLQLSSLFIVLSSLLAGIYPIFRHNLFMYIVHFSLLHITSGGDFSCPVRNGALHSFHIIHIITAKFEVIETTTTLMQHMFTNLPALHLLSTQFDHIWIKIFSLHFLEMVTGHQLEKASCAYFFRHFCACHHNA